MLSGADAKMSSTGELTEPDMLIVRSKDGGQSAMVALGTRNVYFWRPWHALPWQCQISIPHGSAGDVSSSVAIDRYVVAYWFVILIVALVPLLQFIRALRVRSRMRSGLCPACGYDLRATPDRCPECGAVAHKSLRPSARADLRSLT